MMEAGDVLKWVETVKWMMRHVHLQGARMFLEMMDQWATTVNVYAKMFGCAPDDALAYSGEAGYPLTEEEIEMADAKTIRDCRQRADRLEATAKARELTPEEQEELDFIRGYLSEVSFQGRPRKFHGMAKSDRQRKLEALRYTLEQLELDDPELRRYVRSHLQTSPVFRWI